MDRKTFHLPTELQLLRDVNFGLTQVLDNSVSIQWRIDGVLQKEDLVINLETGYLKPLSRENAWAKQRWSQLQRHVSHIARYIKHRLEVEQK